MKADTAYMRKNERCFICGLMWISAEAFAQHQRLAESSLIRSWWHRTRLASYGEMSWSNVRLMIRVYVRAAWLKVLSLVHLRPAKKIVK